MPRKDPFICVLDEIPTIFLPQLVKWLNESREDGFVGILGYQNIGQMEKAYGKELTRVIVGGTATKFVFNPQDYESAKYFSDYFGEEEIEYKSKSKSTGKSPSRSTSEQRQKRALIEPAQLLKMETGEAIIVNPSMTRGTEGYVPIKQKVKVPKADIAEMEESERWWDEICRRLANKNGNQVSDEERSRQFDERQKLVENLFPLPEEVGDSAPHSSGIVPNFSPPNSALEFDKSQPINKLF